METLSFGSKFADPCLIKGREGGEDFHGFLLVSLLLLQMKLRDVKRLFKTGNLQGGHPLVLLGVLHVLKMLVISFLASTSTS
jgi:hypothetical protein